MDGECGWFEQLPHRLDDSGRGTRETDQRPDHMNLDVAEDFSGVISISSGAQITSEQAYGLADRARGITMTVDTQLAMASGSKVFTAATALALIDDGALNLDTTARSLLGSDLPL